MSRLIFSSIISLLFLCVCAIPTSKPPIGYSTCYDLGCTTDSPNLNEKNFREVVDSIVSFGIAEVGLKYVILDDGWASKSRVNGLLQADTMRFPSGIAALADYVHDRGLLFGISTDRGKMTCGGQPGSENYEKIDSETFASWGVDYVKSTSCSATEVHEVAFDQYSKMNSFLNAQNRTIFFAINGEWSWYAPESFVNHIGDSWRAGPEYSTWDSYLVNSDIVSHLYGYTGPSIGWSDIGPLVPFFTPNQRRLQFNVAAISSSPLIFSYDVRKLDAFDLETISNAEVLAVHQDRAGIGAERSVGGPNALAVPPVWSVHQCNSSMPEQQWKLVPVNPDKPELGVKIMSVYLPTYCLAALSGTENGCGTNNQQVFMVDCSGTAVCHDSSAWMLDPKTGLLQNLASPQVLGPRVPGPYATMDQVTCGTYKCHWSAIFLEQKYPASDTESVGRQTWKYDPKTLLLSNAVGVSTNGTCLQSTRPSSYNIWGKLLSDNSFIMLFTNSGAAAFNVTCDTTKCFGPVHMPLAFPVTVRDMWNHVDIGVIQKDQPFAVQLPANGGSAMYRLRQVPPSKASNIQ